MRLKIFAFPILLIVIFFVGFSYIKPEYDAYRLKVDEKKQKQYELSGVEQTLKNVGSLSESLVTNEAQALFVTGYFPSKKLQERAIDAVNVIASRSGVILSGVDVEEQSETMESSSNDVPIPDEFPIMGSLGGTNASEFPNATMPPLPKPKSFSLDVQVSGSYGSTRQFLADIRKLNQLHTIKSFSIVKQEKEAAEGEAPLPDDLLQTSLLIDMFYLPSATIRNAHLLDIFKSSEMDFSSVLGVSSESSGFVPAFPEPISGGRDNPFIR